MTSGHTTVRQNHGHSRSGVSQCSNVGCIPVKWSSVALQHAVEKTFLVAQPVQLVALTSPVACYQAVIISGGHSKPRKPAGKGAKGHIGLIGCKLLNSGIANRFGHNLFRGCINLAEFTLQESSGYVSGFA